MEDEIIGPMPQTKVGAGDLPANINHHCENCQFAGEDGLCSKYGDVCSRHHSCATWDWDTTKPIASRDPARTSYVEKQLRAEQAAEVAKVKTTKRIKN